MKIREIVAQVPERAYLAGFIIITILAVAGSYLFAREGALISKRVEMRQKELARVSNLKDVYVTRKANLERSLSGRETKAPLSLGTVEEMVARSFVSGRLTALRPSTLKEEKGKNLPVIEIRVSGVALGEGLSFTNGVEAAGFRVKKLQLVLPQGQTVLDLYALIGER